MVKLNGSKRFLRNLLSIGLVLAMLLPHSAQAAVQSRPVLQTDPVVQCAESLLQLFQGQLAEAKPKLEQAVAALDKSSSTDYNALGMCALFLGIVQHSTGDWVEALAAYNIALPAFHKKQDPQMEWAAHFGIGTIYLAQGRFANAYTTLQAALLLTEHPEKRGEKAWTTESIRSLARAVNLNNIGLAIAVASEQKQGLGKTTYADAKNYFETALQILRQLSSDQSADPQAMLSSLIMQLALPVGNSQDALNKMLMTLLFSNVAPELAKAFEPILLSNLGQVEAWEGNYSEAQMDLEQALQQIKDSQSQNNSAELQALLPLLDTILNLPGTSLDPKLQQLIHHLPEWLNSLTLTSNVIHLNGEAIVLTNLALIYNQQKQTAKAQNALAQALDISENKLAFYAGAINAHVNLGLLAQQAGKTDAALKHYEQAIQALASVRSVAEGGAAQVREGNPETLNFVNLQGILSQQADVYALAANLYLQKGETAKAFQAVERGRSRLFFDMISTSNAYLKKQDADLLTAVRKAFDIKVQATISLTQLRAVGLANSDLIRKSEQALKDAETLYAGKLAALKRGDPQLQSLVPGVDSTIDLKTLQTQVLDKDTTLVVYYIAEDLLVTPTNQLAVAWVIDDKNITVVKLKLTSKDVRAQIKTLRGSIDKKDFYFAAAQQLYTDLFAPLKPYIHHNNLVIVPNGSLHYLPFAALWDATSKHYLIQDYTLTYAPSASILPLIQSRRNPNDGRLLAMANNSDGKLSEVENEAKAVAQQYKAPPLLGKQATKAYFMANAGRYDLLHIAAHGYYDTANPLASHVELAPSGTITGNLPVSEVFGLPLTKTNLVVLSACKTNLDTPTNIRQTISYGDEIVSLTRAFLYTGTPSIMTTLWSIEDKASAALMTSFYQHLHTENSFAAALRAAQLEILNKDGWHDPYYWAAFTLHGDYLGSGEPKPLPANLFQDNSSTNAPPLTVPSTTTTTLSLEVTTTQLNVRSGPSASYARIGELHQGDRVQIIGQSGDTLWWQVCCVDGQQGWVVNNENYIHMLNRVDSGSKNP